jgi:2-phospho-L-lactate guanylyltransferase
MNCHVLIPCKALASGKSRLASVIDDVARRRLCADLLAATIEAAKGVGPPERIWIVTADEDADSVARRHGVRRLNDSVGELNHALEAARRQLAGCFSFAYDILVLPIDLPFATAPAIRETIEHNADVVLASDLAGTGTNLMYLRRGSVLNFPFAFGAGSFEKHRQAALARCHSLWISHDPRLAFDLDEPRDFAALTHAPKTNAELVS